MVETPIFDLLSKKERMKNVKQQCLIEKIVWSRSCFDSLGNETEGPSLI